MAYVDLNPTRAKVSDSVTSSKHTSTQIRGKAVRGDLKPAAQPLKSVVGCQSYNLTTLSEREYTNLADYAGRQVYPGKDGKIKESELKGMALTLLVNHGRNVCFFGARRHAELATMGRVSVLDFAFAIRCVRGDCLPCIGRSA